MNWLLLKHSICKVFSPLVYILAVILLIGLIVTVELGWFYLLELWFGKGWLSATLGLLSVIVVFLVVAVAYVYNQAKGRI